MKTIIAIALMIGYSALAAESHARVAATGEIYLGDYHVISCDHASISFRGELLDSNKEVYLDASMYISKNKDEKYDPDKIGQTISRLYFRVKDAAVVDLINKYCQRMKTESVRTIHGYAVPVAKNESDPNDKGGTLSPTWIGGILN
jgi:hypothetical protein